VVLKKEAQIPPERCHISNKSQSVTYQKTANFKQTVEHFKNQYKPHSSTKSYQFFGATEGLATLHLWLYPQNNLVHRNPQLTYISRDVSQQPNNHKSTTCTLSEN